MLSDGGGYVVPLKGFSKPSPPFRNQSFVSCIVVLLRRHLVPKHVNDLACTVEKKYSLRYNVGNDVQDEFSLYILVRIHLADPPDPIP